jgi:hypothetical protein
MLTKGTMSSVGSASAVAILMEGTMSSAGSGSTVAIGDPLQAAMRHHINKTTDLSKKVTLKRLFIISA